MIPLSHHFQPAKNSPPLGGRDVHLWRIPLDRSAIADPATLSTDEATRAARFHFDGDRSRFIAGRASLRAILASYLADDPRTLKIKAGPNGKPTLDGAGRWLHFNLSHSRELMLVAVARQLEIGVDVEWTRDTLDFEMLADAHFSKADAAEIRALSGDEKRRRFYQCWTETEAQLKAAGTGLAHGSRVVEPNRWSLLSLEPADGFAAALAVDHGADFALSCWRCAQ